MPKFHSCHLFSFLEYNTFEIFEQYQYPEGLESFHFHNTLNNTSGLLSHQHLNPHPFYPFSLGSHNFGRIHLQPISSGLRRITFIGDAKIT